MDSIDYKQLYKLQDEVLKVIFETEREFYLTGGYLYQPFLYGKKIFR